MTTLLLCQWLHLAAGATFAGGQALVLGAAWPALLGLPAADARRLLGALGPRIGPLMGTSAVLALATGVARLTALGPVRGLADLRTPSGALGAAALGLTLAAMAHGARGGPLLAARVFVGEGDAVAWAPGARGAVARHLAVTGGLVAAILGVMARLRFG